MQHKRHMWTTWALTGAIAAGPWSTARALRDAGVPADDAGVPAESARLCVDVAMRLTTDVEGSSVEFPLEIDGPDASAVLESGTLTVHFDGVQRSDAFPTSTLEYRKSEGEWRNVWIVRLPECEGSECEDAWYGDDAWFELVADLEAAPDISELRRIDFRLTRALEVPMVSRVCLDALYRRRPPGSVEEPPSTPADVAVDDQAPPSEAPSAPGSAEPSFDPPESNAAGSEEKASCRVAPRGSASAVVWLFPLVGLGLRRRRMRR